MSRKDKCVRERRRKVAEIAEEFVRAREEDRAAAMKTPASGARPDDGRQGTILRAVARSGISVYEIARLVDCTADERAMMAQAIAPQLAGMTPGSVFRRHKLADS